jgi:magnesium transporter
VDPFEESLLDKETLVPPIIVFSRESLNLDSSPKPDETQNSGVPKKAHDELMNLYRKSQSKVKLLQKDNETLRQRVSKVSTYLSSDTAHIANIKNKLKGYAMFESSSDEDDKEFFEDEGIVTVVDDKGNLQAMETEVDFGPDGRTLRPKKTSGTLCKLLNRLAWLVALMLILSSSSVILSRFQDLLASRPVLIGFIPVLIGTAGNAGSQLGVAVAKATSRKTVQTCKLLRRELCLSLFTATVLSAATYARVIAEYPQDQMAAMVIALSLFISITAAVVLGILFAIGLEKLSYCSAADGAVPLLNTIIDIVVIVILCELAEAAWTLFPDSTS